MPVKLKVPDKYQPYLAEFANLSPEVMAALVEGLRDARPSLELDEFAESIANRLSIDSARARRFVELLSSLHAVREGMGGGVEDFLAELRAAVEATGSAEMQPADWEAFQRTIADALAADTALSVSAKALDVMTDHQRVFLYARVLTDLRPIFRLDVAAAPAAMVAVHHLKIVCREDGVPREFFVTLDRADLATLVESLQRALEKEKSLRALAENKSLTLLEVKT